MLLQVCVPANLYCSTYQLKLQYQQAGTAVPVYDVPSWYCDALTWFRQYIVLPLTILCHRKGNLLSNLFTSSFSVMLVYFDVKMVQMHQKANNPLIQGFQLEKIFFPVRNIFFSNWALFPVQLGAFRLSRYSLQIYALRICKDFLS